MDVERLLNSLREHGTIDSQGEFTIDLLEARRKMAKYQSSNPARYLLCLVSAGLAGGGTSLRIRYDERNLEVKIPGTRIAEEDLRAAYSGRSQEGLSDAALDLALAMHLALQTKCESLEVESCVEGQLGFHWQVSLQALDAVPVEMGTENCLLFNLSWVQSWKHRWPKILKFFGGYAGEREEIRLLEQHCDNSFTPIYVNEQSLDRPLLLPEASVCALVGDPQREAIRFNPRLRFHPDDWEGYLALRPGSIKLVHYGVTLHEFKSSCLSGVISHDGLHRDLSREGVLKDATYEAFTAELSAFELEMIQDFAENIGLWKNAEILLLLDDLVSHALHPSQQSIRNRLSAWISRELGVVPGQGPSTRRNTSVLELLTLYRKLYSVTMGTEGQAHTEFVLKMCAAALKNRSAQVDQMLSESADLITKYYPHDSLAAGYCLLGLGACLSAFGQPGAARMTWNEAIVTVRKLKDPDAVALIEAHLEFEPDHMMQEVSKALSLYVKSKSSD